VISLPRCSLPTGATPWPAPPSEQEGTDMPFSRRELLAGALAAGGAAIARRAFGETQPPARPHPLVIDTHAHYYPADRVEPVKKEGPANGARIGKNDRGAATFSVPGIDAFFAPPYIDLDIRLK